MARKTNKIAKKQLKLPLLGVAIASVFALPSAGLAVVGLSGGEATGGQDSHSASAFDLFTPASVDPELAARIADKTRQRGIRFTPAGTNIAGDARSVTVAVRIDDESAKAISLRNISLRKIGETRPGNASGLLRLQGNRFSLGAARGYQSFASTPVETLANPPVVLSEGPRQTQLADLSLPDLAEFEPAPASRPSKPGRLQPRLELEGEQVAGRSPNTLNALSSQTVDVGGSFRVSPNLNVTAGVRYSQERDRLTPLTNSLEDSQAVYVGTRIRF